MTLALTDKPRPVLHPEARKKAAEVLRRVRANTKLTAVQRRHVDARAHWKRLACLDLVPWVLLHRQTGNPQVAHDLDLIIQEWSAPA